MCDPFSVKETFQKSRSGRLIKTAASWIFSKQFPIHDYSSVPNRRVGRNKRAGGKILRKY